MSTRIIGRLKLKVNKVNEVARAEERPGSDHSCYLSPAYSSSGKSSYRCQHKRRDQCSSQRVEADTNDSIGQITSKRDIEEQYTAEQWKKEGCNARNHR